MYSEHLKKIAASCENKSAMIKLSLNRVDRQAIESATTFYEAPLKVKCLLVLNDYDATTIPKCPNCSSAVSFDKEYQNSFNKFCSNSCSKQYGRLSTETKSTLTREWLLEKRVEQQLSFECIAEELGISTTTLKKKCQEFGIPEFKLNESDHAIKTRLNDIVYLKALYSAGSTMADIAETIGTSKATISKVFKDHDIEARLPNSYERKIAKRSKAEIELEDFINSLGVVTTNSNRSILNGKEIDILCGDVAFEYNGIYSHCEESGKDRKYHLEKTTGAAEKGIKLFHIFEDTFVLKPNIVKSMVASKLNRSPFRVFARKAEIVIPSSQERTKFLNDNHIQGSDKATLIYGLKYEGELVAVMTFCKSRYNKHFTWELSRYACRNFTSVVGGFSKLLAAFRKDNSGSVISYADRAVSDGNVYSKNGFERIRTNPPSYYYVKNSSIKRMHRANFMKAKIGKDDPRSEREIMKDAGYLKIWDCGTFAYGIY